ncbi:MAG: DNA-binding protein [Micrococcales bacterium]|nr:DNA-binding protein [Micrococcales bacterium]
MKPLASLAQALRRILTPPEELEAGAERAAAQVAGTTPVANLAGRQHFRVSGLIRSVATTGRGQPPGFELDLFDGTGSLRVVWQGQRAILGLDAGRHLIVEGLVSIEGGGRAVMRNPHYQLVPSKRATA